MTAPQVLKIITTVAVTQCGCDLVTRWLVYSREPYKRAVSALERAQCKRDKLIESLNTPQKLEKQAKKLQRAQDDCAEAASEVARRHSVPGFICSLVFLILYRILSTEYSGQVVAVLPFEAFSLLRRLTLRGLDIDGSAAANFTEKVTSTNQACAFLFIYILSTVSVKFFVHKLVAVHPPKEAAGGISTVMDAPKNQKMLKSLGIDTDALKQDVGFR